MKQKERLIAGYTGSSARRGDVFTFVVYEVGGKLRACLQGGRVTLASRSTLAGLCLNNTVQKDSRGVLGTTFRFGRLSENSRQISNMAD